MSLRTIDLNAYSDSPTVKGMDGAQQFLAEKGIDVAQNAISDAVYYKKTLERFKIGRAIHFSERELMRWVYSGRGRAGQ